MNDAQLAWSYLNIVEDVKETHKTIKAFLDWFKWFVNPEASRAAEEADKRKISVDPEQYIKTIRQAMKEEGKSEEEIEEVVQSIINEDLKKQEQL